MDIRSKSNAEFRNEVNEALARHESTFDQVNATLQAVLSELQALRTFRNSPDITPFAPGSSSSSPNNGCSPTIPDPQGADFVDLYQFSPPRSPSPFPQSCPFPYSVWRVSVSLGFPFRRSPTPFSDSLNDSVHDPFSESLPQESSRDVPYSIALSSQDSSSPWSTFNSEPNTRHLSLSPSSNQSTRRSFNDSRNGVVSKTTKARVWKRKVELPTSHRLSFLATSTLMEAQEFGELMEHVGKVNFAWDGLRKAQPARIIRASLLSLLSICETGQQRQLLRTQGMAKTIIDSILSLNFDDSSSNMAADSDTRDPKAIPKISLHARNFDVP